MKKALCVMAVVAGYSLVETALLLSYLCFEFENRRSFFLACGLYLSLPGAAVLFSRLIYGRRGWIRRALTIIVSGTLGAPAFVILLFLPAGLVAWAFPDRDEWLLAGFLAGIAGVAWALIWVFRRTRPKRLQDEADRWLAERRAGIDPMARGLRNRSIAWALSIPSAIVLFTVLFFPELWGVVTHVHHRGASQLIDYEVPIPATWIIVYNSIDASGGDSSVGGLLGRGIGRGGPSYLPGPGPFSKWSVWTKPHERENTGVPPWLTKERPLSAQRVFPIGGAQLTCLEYSEVDAHVTLSARGWADIECASPAGLYADFVGDKRNVPAFYEMLAGIAKAR